MIGYNNVNVVYRVITKYSTYTENYAISSATGCVTHSYAGQPADGGVRIEVVTVLNYTVSGTSATPLWDGVTPSLNVTAPR